MIEKANKDFHENRKEFLGICWQDLQRVVVRVYCLFEGSCVTSTKGVLCEHYERLSTASADVQFDASWKEHVGQKVTEYSEMSQLRKVKVLDSGISFAEI